MRALSWLLATVAGVSLACSTSGPPTSSGDGDTVFYFNGRVVRGDESPAIDHAAFVVERGIMTRLAVQGGLEAPRGATAIDLAGRTVMPLLHTLHAHVGYLDGRTFAAENYSRDSVLADLQRHAYYGVGSVAVLGTDVGDIAFDIRDAQIRGDLPGYARLVTAGRGITTPGGWPTVIPGLKDAPRQVATEDEARAAVQELFERKADLVKIWVDDNLGTIPKIPLPIAAAAIDEAHRRGLKAVAHVFYLDDARALVEARIDGLMHSIRDRDVDDELIAMMREAGTYYVPTLVAHETAFSYADAPPWVGEPAMRETVPESMIAWLTSEEFLAPLRQNPALDGVRRQYAVAERNVKALHDAGVPIGLGTDSGTANRFPGYVEHRELELLVRAGLSPTQAITAATRNGAAFLGIERSGTLGASKRADFIVVDGDPLADIAATRRIVAVSHAGHYIDRDGMAIRTTLERP